MAYHVHHHYHHKGDDGWGSVIGCLLFLFIVGWLFYVMPWWAWVVVFIVFIVACASRK